MTDIGVATRVHGREEDARVYYILARQSYLALRRQLGPHDFRWSWTAWNTAMYRRSAWSSLREIIDAEERRAAREPDNIEPAWWPRFGLGS